MIRLSSASIDGPDAGGPADSGTTGIASPPNSLAGMLRKRPGAPAEDDAGTVARADMTGSDLSAAIIARTREITSALTTFLPGQS